MKWIINLHIKYLDTEDYDGGMRTVPIEAGLLEEMFMINIVDNSIVECSEAFNVRIVSVTGDGVIIGNDNNTEVVITDNDSKWKVLLLDRWKYS